MPRLDGSRAPTSKLTGFDALLRELSVTRAGKTLGLSQSAISHSLTRLRAYFDDPLFVKTHRGSAPTAKSEALSSVIQDLMATVRDQVLPQVSILPPKHLAMAVVGIGSGGDPDPFTESTHE